MTEDERDECIGMQLQAADWWKRAQHHLKMRETAKTWDSFSYAGVHAKLDQHYAHLAHAKALQLLCGPIEPGAQPSAHDLEEQRHAIALDQARRAWHVDRK